MVFAHDFRFYPHFLPFWHETRLKYFSFINMFHLHEGMLWYKIDRENLTVITRPELV